MKNFIGRRAWWTVGVLVIGLLGGLTWAPGSAFSAWTVGKPIVTYFAGPYMTDMTPSGVTNAQQLADGGWNLVWANTVDQMNEAASKGLRVMWAGSLSVATVASVRDNPSLYAYWVTPDEPSVSDFAGIAATVSHLRALDPNRVAYTNLGPNYGVSDYRAFLNQYISTVDPSLLSYDHYSFMENGTDNGDYFKNLAIISHTAKEAGIPFIQVVQACNAGAMRIPNGNELRYFYSTSLAYGAQGISDFVYTGQNIEGGMAVWGTWETTPLYDAAKTINPEFVANAQQVQSLHHIGAYHLGDLPPGYGTIDGSSPMRLPGNSPFTLSSEDMEDTDYGPGEPPVKGVVLGLWGPDDQLLDATHTLVVNLDYVNGLNTRVMGPDDLSVFDPATGRWIAQGHAWADVSMAPGGGVLVGLTSVVPEPSALVLLVTGLIGLLCYAWRKRACIYEKGLYL